MGLSKYQIARFNGFALVKAKSEKPMGELPEPYASSMTKRPSLPDFTEHIAQIACTLQSSLIHALVAYVIYSSVEVCNLDNHSSNLQLVENPLILGFFTAKASCFAVSSLFIMSTEESSSTTGLDGHASPRPGMPLICHLVLQPLQL